MGLLSISLVAKDPINRNFPPQIKDDTGSRWTSKASQVRNSLLEAFLKLANFA